jgi:hypothetical protein
MSGEGSMISERRTKAMKATQRNNILAGTFLILALALGVILSIVLSDADKRIRSTNNYTVRFSLAQGAHGLKTGSQVLLGGQPVGWVRGVDVYAMPQTIGEGNAASTADLPSTGFVDVGIAVRSDVTLFENAVATLERPLLGNTSNLNFVSVGEAARVSQARGNGPQLEPGEILAGELAVPTFLQSAGYGPEQADQLRSMVKNASEATERFNSIALRAQEDVPAILADARESTKTVRERLPGWSQQVDSTLGSVERGSASFESMIEDGRQAVTDARKAIATTQEILDRNGPKIDATMDSLRSASAKIDQQSVDEFNALVRTASAGIDRFNSTVSWISSWFGEESPGMRKILANGRLASDQLKLAMIEIRQSPWKLLYSPGTKELENEVLYDATRTYAQAVSDLRAAGESLDSAVRNPTQGVPLDVEAIKTLRAKLDEAFGKYEEAERVLLAKIGQKSR